MTAQEAKEKTMKSPNVQLELKPILEQIEFLSNGGDFSLEIPVPKNEGVVRYLKDKSYTVVTKNEKGTKSIVIHWLAPVEEPIKQQVWQDYLKGSEAEYMKDNKVR